MRASIQGMKQSNDSRLKSILEKAIGKQALPPHLDASTPLIGEIADFDSMAVLAVLTGIEQSFEVTIADDEVSADIFDTFGSLQRFVEAKLDDKR